MMENRLGYPPRIQAAIELAIRAHWVGDHQYRKGKDQPYITHPMTVALILDHGGASEDVVIAGLLHDTIEDCDVTREQLEDEFGWQVAELVDSVTEQDKSLPWEVRKEQAIEHIAEMSEDSLMLKSADLISNLTEIKSDWDRVGDEAFGSFNRDQKTTLDYYRRAIDAIQMRWAENPLDKDLAGIQADIVTMLAKNPD